MTNDEYQLFLPHSPRSCRCCGMEKSSGISLQEPGDRAVKVMRTLSLFPKRVINISPSDKLSKFVCMDCEVILLHFSDFCEMIRKVQKNLKSQQKTARINLDKTNEDENSRSADCHISGSSRDGLPVVISVGRDNYIKCQACQHCLVSDQLITLHMLTHGLGTVLCACKHCGHQDDIGNFLHHNNNVVKCPQCLFISGADTTSQPSKTSEGSHVCEVCNTRFQTKYRYNRHKLIHTGSKPFLCETCGMKFNQKAGLKLHMMKHTKANPHSCQWCGQSFRFKVSLQSHILNVHGSSSGAGTKECDQCRKQFVTIYKLRRHYRVHTGDRPYTCPTCSKCFSHTGNLKNHMKKHKSENSDNFSETFSAAQLLESDQILDTILDSCPQGKEFLELEQGQQNYGLVSGGNVDKHNPTDLFPDFNPQDVLFVNTPLLPSANPNSSENVMGF